jgi:uncharacterized protein YjiS (DUF1127 family)
MSFEVIGHLTATIPAVVRSAAREYLRRRRERQAIRQLMAMSPWQLKDIGLNRGEIEFTARNAQALQGDVSTFREPPR